MAGDLIAGGAPMWIADLALPVGFGLIALRLAWRASPALAGPRHRRRSASSPASSSTRTARSSTATSFLPWLVADPRRRRPRRADLRAARRHRALRLAGRGTPPAVLPLMAYQQLTTSTGHRRDPAVHARRVPARRRASRRSGCCALFRAWSGWMPGGTAIAAATLCAFFTLFTGGSGVTILVLGGLLLPALVGQRLSRAVFDRPADRVRIARPAVSAVAAADALRHRVAEGVDRGSLHRRAAAGAADARPARGAGRSRGDRHQGASARRSAPARRWRRCGKRSGSCCCRSSSLGAFLGGIATLVESAPVAALYTRHRPALHQPRPADLEGRASASRPTASRWSAACCSSSASRRG